MQWSTVLSVRVTYSKAMRQSDAVSQKADAESCGSCNELLAPA